jgi:hypothetical protein
MEVGVATVVEVLAGWVVISVATASVFSYCARSLKVPIAADQPQPSSLPDPIDLRLPLFSRVARATDTPSPLDSLLTR